MANVNNAPIMSPTQNEPMITDESEKEEVQPTNKGGVGPLQLIIKDNTKPLEMPSTEKVTKVSGYTDRSFTSLSFAEKTAMFEPILELPKVSKVSKVDESNLNKYLVALTTVKGNLRDMRVLCDKDTEHWIIMIVLSTLDEASLRWWKLLMVTARPAIEVLSDFLATRVENLKAEAEAKPFRIPLKRSSSPELSSSDNRSSSPDNSEKRSRSRSNTRSRPTGAKPKAGASGSSTGSGPSSTRGSGQPDCRYCKKIGHVVANYRK